MLGINVASGSQTNVELLAAGQKIPHFRGVYMRNTLPKTGLRKRGDECGIMNFNLEGQQGSHWVAYCKRGHSERIYFDSFGYNTPHKLLQYLKNGDENAQITRSQVQVQHDNTHECGGLCIAVLHALMTSKVSYNNILKELEERFQRQS